jgi:hypothetical protein
MFKIDVRLVANDVKRIDGGFRAFVGLHWIHSAGDMPRILRWLRPLFEPLLDVAGAAYMD